MSVRLDNWSIHPAHDKRYYVLVGDAYGHPRHHNGKSICTSYVVGRLGEAFLTVNGSSYVLGQHIGGEDAAKEALAVLHGVYPDAAN